MIYTLDNLPERKKPNIDELNEVARSRLFCVEELKLTFSNGERRVYERLKAGGSGAVLILPVTSNNDVLFIREYAAGIDRYELALPKGLVDQGETPIEAANRELKEEVGFGSGKLTELKKVSLAPGYLSHTMTIVLAEDLYPEKLVGDEPEEIDVISVPISEIKTLIHNDILTEARSIAALYLMLDKVNG
ncbi:MAG: ADP compounds hydrolase NudE [Kangiellaceae bacterium]|jgi:ADP-ribose diphosphatase|nr:ADP compounds hydrolase NudE [Kangiellaceae bacterium]